MNTSRDIMQPIPQPLKIVAWLFIVGGIYSAIQVVVLLCVGHININFGVLCIFIGQGLLRLNRRSLSWALFFTWLGLIFTPLFIILFLFTPGRLKIFGLNVGQAPPGLGSILGCATLALVYWQYRVLTNRQIRQLFVPTS